MSEAGLEVDDEFFIFSELLPLNTDPPMTLLLPLVQGEDDSSWSWRILMLSIILLYCCPLVENSYFLTLSFHVKNTVAHKEVQIKHWRRQSFFSLTCHVTIIIVPVGFLLFKEWYVVHCSLMEGTRPLFDWLCSRLA